MNIQNDQSQCLMSEVITIVIIITAAVLTIHTKWKECEKNNKENREH